LAVVAVVKDEADYLAEWIEFHAMLGVTAFYIYDNGSIDATAELLHNNGWSAAVTRVPWRSFDGFAGTQRLAHCHALVNFGPAHRWMAFIDVDEFVYPRRGASLTATLELYSNQPAVSLPWFNFGPSGHWEKPSGIVIENYIERAPLPPRADQYSLIRYKTIVDPQEVTAAGVHHFKLQGHGYVLINENGKIFPPFLKRDPKFMVSKELKLNHYFTRSHAELLVKLAKGRVSRNGGKNPTAYNRRLRQYALAIERDEEILRFVSEIKRRLALRSDYLMAICSDRGPSNFEPTLGRPV